MDQQRADDLVEPSLDKVRMASRAASDAAEKRDRLIHEAWFAGSTLRDIANAAELSHTTINRIVQRAKEQPTMAVRDTWSQYENRYASRPGTFRAYVDVWLNVSEARQVFSGWASFSQAANAEPAQSPDRVRAAERCMDLWAYELGPLTSRGARQWQRKQSGSR